MKVYLTQNHIPIILIPILLLFILPTLHAQSLYTDTLVQIGTSGTETVESIQTDVDGYIYVTGKATRSWSSISTVVEPYVYGEDVYITKIDPFSYQIIWTTHLGSQAGGSAYDYSTCMHIDTDKNIYIAGYTGSTFSNIPTLSTEGKGFFAKFDSLGQRVWLSHEGPIGSGALYGISTDPSGNIYVSGNGTGSIHGQTAIGESDLFTVKYNASGAVLWTKQLGSSSTDYHRGLVFKNGFIYTTGYANASISTDPHIGNNDVFLTKFDANGQEIWKRSLGSSVSDQSYDIEVDNQGNIYITGRTAGSFQGANHSGGDDIFIAKFNNQGNILWTNQYGTSANDISYRITLSANHERIYLAGKTQGSIDGIKAANSSGDYYISWLDTSGNILGTIQRGSSSVELAKGINIGLNGRIYVVGITSGSLGNFSNQGNYDIFVETFVDPLFETALSAETLNFKAQRKENGVLLRWKSMNKQSTFELERSTDGLSWETIPLILSNKRKFSVWDKDPLLHKTYYRLKQILANQSYSYSPIRVVEPLEKQNLIQVYPVPVLQEFYIESPHKTIEQIRVYSSEGKELNLTNQIDYLSSKKVRISTQSLATGLYFVQVNDTVRSLIKK